ncbi:MAG: hypothetical protein A3G93_00725 [Nitrospinae bacterium RIFCSPLOWO2_12_FULL_45_22]|nr:MAG: hypothetical protein A3G93_00725 [Nitrospinae bacterium RIFCSPLOWO2_12_FULL_45_22]
MTYRVLWTPRAEREYKKLPPNLQKEADTMISHLERDPFRHPGKGVIKKYKSGYANQYRFKLTPLWRCMYEVIGEAVTLLSFYRK